MTTRPTTLAIALLLLATPLALGGWRMMGSYEPDTNADITGGWMFLSPDVNPSQSVEKVYFNGFFGQCVTNFVNVIVGSACTGLNENVATLRTSAHPPEYLLEALLGVWKDCNNDGFVGLGDQGLFEYRTTLLVATSGDRVCPTQPVPAPDKYGNEPLNWTPVHNDGTWVHELLPIQWLDVRNINPDGTVRDLNPWGINDNGARVWADVGAPGTYHNTCYYRSYPVGTFHSTGFMLHTFDCLDAYKITDTLDQVTALNPALAPLSFADHPRDQENSQSLLNQPNPWGNPSDGSDAQVWDCSKAQTSIDTPAALPAGTGGQHIVNVSQPKLPPSSGTGGDLAGTANATGSGFDQCNRNTQNNGATEALGRVDEHMGDALANEPYALETGTALPPYKQASDVLAPVQQTRPSAPLASIPGYGKSGPGDAGLRWVTDDCPVVTCVQGMDGIWSGNRIYHVETTMTDANVNGGISKPAYFSYYALVSSTAVTQYGLLLPKGSATGTYGVEACGSATSGILNGWDCNGADWYKDSSGNSIEPSTGAFGGTTYLGERPGDAYNLRDIDCYDESFQQARGAGVGWGALTSSPECDSTP